MEYKNIKFRVKMDKFSKGCWAVGLSLIHIPKETILYIKLFKWHIDIGFMGEDWV